MHLASFLQQISGHLKMSDEDKEVDIESDDDGRWVVNFDRLRTHSTLVSTNVGSIYIVYNDNISKANPASSVRLTLRFLNVGNLTFNILFHCKHKIKSL